MFKSILSISLLGLLSISQAFSQNSFVSSPKLAKLQPKIDSILSKYDAKVGVAIHSHDLSDSLIVNGDHRYPLQSVYKFHLGIVILDQVDKGKLYMKQPLVFSKETMNTELYSPIKDAHPNGVTMRLDEVLFHTIAESDNIGCDAMFDLLGGPKVVDTYFKKLGFKDQNIAYTERVQQAKWDIQFENWTTVSAGNHIMHAFYTNDDQLLSKKSYNFLWDNMRKTSTGPNRIKGLLPMGTVVAHKTGTSGRNRQTGVTAAINDIGVVSLPDGKVFYISVYVTDSNEVGEPNERIVAEVSKVAYDAFVE